MPRSIALILTLLAVLLAACGPGGAAQAPTSVAITRGNLTISAAWARATAPAGEAASAMPADTSGAVYLTIANSATTPATLLSASTSIAQAAELHTMTMANGVMQMRPVAGGLAIPANGGVALTPGGPHLMLIGLRRPLRPGDTFELTMQFAHAPAITCMVQVRKR